MTYETFLSILSRLQSQGDKIQDLYHKYHIDLIDFADPYESVVTTLITEIYGAEGIDWFSWYCYENDFGNKMSLEKPKAWDKDETPICYDHKSLWEYMEGLRNN